MSAPRGSRGPWLGGWGGCVLGRVVAVGCCPRSLPSRTLLTAPPAALHRDWLRLPQVPRPSPALRVPPPAWGWGLSGRPARAAGCWAPSKRLAGGTRRFFSLLSGVPRVSERGSHCPLPLLLPAPAAQVPGTAEPCLHLPGVTPTPTRCSSSPSPLETPSPRWRRRRLPSSPACPALLGPRANLGSGRARRRRGWASSTCSSAHWPRGSRRAGRRWRAPCAPGDAVLTRPAPPRCILIPGHCGRCTPSGKPLAGVAGRGTHCTDVLGCAG